MRDVGSVPLPYPENYFSHIKASMLPSLVPSANLPELFSECYKLLAPGGLLEIRIMDAAPVRKTTGPLMRSWVEDRLSNNLERLFRCSKPCLLVPVWLKDADFELCDEAAGQGCDLAMCYRSVLHRSGEGAYDGNSPLLMEDYLGLIRRRRLG